MFSLYKMGIKGDSMMNIVLCDYLYDEDEVLTLYKSVGWKNYIHDPVMLKNAYQHSLCIMSAYVGEKLAGIVRAVGDGYSIIYIQDLIVHPDYQKKGIGTALINAIFEKYRNVYQIVLLSDEDNVGFYEKIGFKKASDMDCCTFIKQRESECV